MPGWLSALSVCASRWNSVSCFQSRAALRLSALMATDPPVSPRDVACMHAHVHAHLWCARVSGAAALRPNLPLPKTYLVGGGAAARAQHARDGVPAALKLRARGELQRGRRVLDRSRGGSASSCAQSACEISTLSEPADWRGRPFTVVAFTSRSERILLTGQLERVQLHVLRQAPHQVLLLLGHRPRQPHRTTTTI